MPRMDGTGPSGQGAMTGGGFGGSVVAMVAPAEVDSISKTLASAYFHATGLSIQPLPVVAVNGAQAHNTRES